METKTCTHTDPGCWIWLSAGDADGTVSICAKLLYMNTTVSSVQWPPQAVEKNAVQNTGDVVKQQDGSMGLQWYGHAVVSAVSEHLSKTLV